MQGRLISALLAATTLAFPTSVLAADDAAKVETSQKDPHGEYLTDAGGMTLYIFVLDPMNESTCYDDCAAAWPPAVTSAEPAAGEGVDENMISTIERKDGSQQLTYHGRPLYYFTRDQQAGDVKGQNVEGFGGQWHMVSPEGEKVEGES